MLYYMTNEMLQQYICNKIDQSSTTFNDQFHHLANKIIMIKLSPEDIFCTPSYILYELSLYHVQSVIFIESNDILHSYSADVDIFNKNIKIPSITISLKDGNTLLSLYNQTQNSSAIMIQLNITAIRIPDITATHRLIHNSLSKKLNYKAPIIGNIKKLYMRLCYMINLKFMNQLMHIN